MIERKNTYHDFYDDYADSLNDHIKYVIEFGQRLGVDPQQLSEHDASKWGAEEFGPYARYFHNGKGNPTEMARAWLHHLRENPHHWQYWIFPSGASAWSPNGADVEDGALEMPEKYVLEMVADWHGASYSYTGSWEIYDWLLANLGGIHMHSKSREFLSRVLQDLGYKVP